MGQFDKTGQNGGRYNSITAQFDTQQNSISNNGVDPNVARGRTSQRDQPTNPWAAGSDRRDPGAEYIVASERELKYPYNVAMTTSAMTSLRIATLFIVILANAL